MPPKNPCFEFYKMVCPDEQKWYGQVEDDKLAVVYAKTIDEALLECRKAHPKLKILGVYCHSLLESAAMLRQDVALRPTPEIGDSPPLPSHTD